MSLTHLDSTLTALSPLDGRYASKTQGLREFFSESALFKYRFIVEIKWLNVLIHQLHLAHSPKALTGLTKLIEEFNDTDAKNIKALDQKYNHDVKAVEYYVKECLTHIPELTAHQEWVHFGCTSEDINNLAYALMLKEGLEEVIFPALDAIFAHLNMKAQNYAAIAMLSRTHGQAATPTTLGKEFANVAYRLKRLINKLKRLEILGKFNGAVGNYNAHRIALPDLNWPQINQAFVESLGLNWNPYTTQIEPHDYLAEILSTFALMETVLIDFCKDIWSYISLKYFKQLSTAREVGSSTMPHKVNPIDFENAEGNFSLSQAIAQFLANRLPQSRFQRDLVDSTLMRNIGIVFGYALVGFQSLLKGLNRIEPDEEIIKKDLTQHPEVLAEAIQMIMRAHHLPMPYEALKDLTRGREISLDELRTFIQTLDLPSLVKQELLSLTPEKYLGYAVELAKK